MRRSAATSPIPISARATIRCSRLAASGWSARARSRRSAKASPPSRRATESPILAALIANAKAGGFRIDSFADNGTMLPYTAHAAAQTGLPLHRGPHPFYTEIVQQGLHRLAAPLSPWFGPNCDPVIAADILRRAAKELCSTIDAIRAPGNVITINELQLPGDPHDELWKSVACEERRKPFARCDSGSSCREHGGNAEPVNGPYVGKRRRASGHRNFASIRRPH